MIKRYARPQMTQYWSDQAKYEAWLAVELAVCEVYHEEGMITEDEMQALRKASFEIARIEAIEQETRHDVVAFTRAVSETLGDEKTALFIMRAAGDAPFPAATAFLP